MCSPVPVASAGGGGGWGCQLLQCSRWSMFAFPQSWCFAECLHSSTAPPVFQHTRGLLEAQPDLTPSLHGWQVAPAMAGSGCGSRPVPGPCPCLGTPHSDGDTFGATPRGSAAALLRTNQERLVALVNNILVLMREFGVRRVTW